ncbi:MAG: ATP-binding cassette domain-containing protein [Bacilli bacterium]|jgi:ATP-binding cassette subfamily F protein 3
MVEISNLTIKIRPNRPIINGLDLILNKGDKLAVIGEEGNGKSTLFKAINNINDIKSYCEVEGTILKKKLKIGLLEQALSSDWNQFLVSEYFLKITPTNEIDYDKYNDFHRLINILLALNLDPKILDSNQKIKTLSGGEKIKLQIAKVLINDPDVLLLDEPTNDLDLYTLEWLENFINNQNMPIMFISHDETLLENTANMILHLEQIKGKQEARHTLVKKSYQEYIYEREIALKKQEQLAIYDQRDYLKRKHELSYQKSAVRSAQEKIKDSAVRRTLNKKMKNIVHQEQKLANTQLTTKPDIEDAIYIEFEPNITIPTNKVILNLERDELKIGPKRLTHNIKLLVKGPEKIVIVGQNGIGKTVLLKMIYDELKNRKDIKVGYMPQNYDDVLNTDMVALDYLYEGLEIIDESKIRAYMGNMKFTSDEMLFKIGNLSSGQKAKLLILKLILDKCNVLILDEPTRNLSPLSNPVIRKMLKDYKGTIISVSHDRKYIMEVRDVVYELTSTGMVKKN